MKRSKWHVPSIASSVAFAAFSAVHLIDDFLADIPAEFNLTVPATEILSLAYMIALVGLIATASHQSKLGYLGLAIAGLLISASQFAKSIPEILYPGPWRFGLPSELLSLGLTISALLTAWFSFRAWRMAAADRGGSSGESPPT